jgi:ATP-binding cassette subfamily A (ABC1) protein 3
MCYGLLVEKEKKIREGMKMMGMKNTSFYISWILYYLIIYTFISLLVSAVLKGAIFNNTDYFVLFIWHWLFCWSLIF